MHFSYHAAKRMVERHVTADEVRAVVAAGTHWPEHDGRINYRLGEIFVIMKGEDVLTVVRVEDG